MGEPQETPGLREALDWLAAEFPVEDASPGPWVVEQGSVAWMVREGPGGPQIGNFILEADARFVAAARAALSGSPQAPRCDFDCLECSEKEADADIAAGRVTTYNSVEEFAASLAVGETPPGPLDVERLARAIATANGQKKLQWAFLDEAAMVAREYARLTATPPGEETP